MERIRFGQGVEGSQPAPPDACSPQIPQAPPAPQVSVGLNLHGEPSAFPLSALDASDVPVQPLFCILTLNTAVTA